jgi:hypothetical protein
MPDQLEPNTTIPEVLTSEATVVLRKLPAPEVISILELMPVAKDNNFNNN